MIKVRCLCKLYKLQIKLNISLRKNLIEFLATGNHKYDILQAAIYYLELSDSASFGALHGADRQG